MKNISTPKVAARRRLSPELRRAQLLECAMACCAEISVDRVGHGDIAKRAGVSTATVFNYFPTRTDLINSVFTEITRIVTDMFDLFEQQAGVSKLKLEQQFQMLTAAYAHLIETRPDYVKTFLNWSVTFNPDVRPQYLEFQTMILSRIRAALPDALQSDQDMRIIYGAANVYAVMKIDGTDQATLDGFVTRLIEAILGSDNVSEE